MSKKIAIIGAGASGLAAIKCCLDEGLTPVCFERTDHVGGLWYYTEEVTDGQACVMKSTVINTSKEIMTYSDFPIPADYPVFMHNTKVKEYLEQYGKHFNAERYIHFQTEVVKMKLNEKSDKGEWDLTIKDHEKGTTTTQTYDGVMVCTGHHAEKNVPKFEGLETFKGQVVHTHDYRDHVGYEGKRVLVVGIGNSGGDVAVELSRICEQVYLSTRRGTWVINRIADNGYPADLLGIRRVTDLLQSIVPRPIFNSILEARLNSRFNHANYGLQAKHRFDAQHPMVNDELPNRIACGTVLIKPDIRRFTPSGVEFEDGSRVEQLDAVILATGFKFGFPFVDHPALAVEKNKVQFYKYVFPPDIQPATLAVIGCVQPVGAIMPISEIQCRWAARVFAGASALPSKDIMWDDIRRKEAEMADRYVESQRHTIQVDYIQIMDEVAEHFGCRPDLGKMFWEDPVLALKCYFGPFSPYQYRLTGPGQWDKAREHILTVWDRTLAPTRTKPMLSNGPPTWVYIVAVVFFAILIKWFLGFLF